MNEFILKPGPPLPDVFLLQLANKSCLNEKDCVSLVASGASGRFNFLFWDKRKRLAIGQCFFLTPMYCDSLFQKHFYPLSLKIFDASHLYWIPAQILASGVAQMLNLEELSCHDTKLSLVHLHKIFETCKKIVKLSFSLLETNLDAFQERFLDGFGRLTKLKMFTINQSENDATVCLPVTFGVLSWCRDCVHLHIEIAYPYITQSPKTQQAQGQDLEDIRRTYRSKLGWLKSLRSLVIIPHPQADRSGSAPEGYSPGDPLVMAFIDLLFSSQDLLSHSLERLWIPSEYSSSRLLTIDQLPAPLVKSLHLWEEDGVRTQLDHKKFNQMEHLSDIDFSDSYDEMQKLEYASGNCVDNVGLSLFCKAHPDLLHLYFSTSLEDPQDDEVDYSIGDGDFALPKLITLGYYSTSGPSEVTMGHLMENCPNIQVLQLSGDISALHSLPMDYSMNHLGRIQFPNLVKLTLDDFEMGDGKFLVPIVKQCPKLRILLIGGHFTPGVFFSSLAECLPFAKNLRDLRLEWKRKEKVSSILALLKNLLDCSEYLERLVLHHRDWYSSKRVHWKCSPELEDLLVGFATEMDHLVALCFAGFLVTPKVVRKVNLRVKSEILPHRPAFWFYLGKDLPKANDVSVPRIHIQEVVEPVDVHCPTPPTFR